MRIGVPKESKNGEYRVALTPESVRELVRSNHAVFIEENASIKIGISNDDYIKAGAVVLPTAYDVFQETDMVVKVKEPSLTEAAQFKEDQIIFCYLHLAPNPPLTHVLLDRKVIGVAFETITSKNGHPLLCPMSQVAGRMATQVGAHLLETSNGGMGLLMSGIPGLVKPARVVILGAGTVGSNAAQVAAGMGAEVVMLDGRIEPLLNSRLDVRKLVLTPEVLEREILQADIVIGAIHVAGAKTDKLVSESLVKRMKKGSVIIDVSIDQGGCFETSQPTSHDYPVYSKHGVIHYCVPNMPGAVPYTSTYALNTFLLQYVMQIANEGIHHVLQVDKDIFNGVHVYKGHVTNQFIAESINKPLVDLSTLL